MSLMNIAAIIDRFEPLIIDAMTEQKIPGLSVAVVKDDEVIYERGFGARDCGTGAAVTPDTLFGIGSCTKSFTSLAVMQLVHDGKIDVDDPISKYVPVTLESGRKPISVHRLLTHSSGIPDLGIATLAIAKLLGKQSHLPAIPLASWEDFYTHVNGAGRELIEPGSRFWYFNGGYIILGQIVARTSGISYENYVKEHILKPLDMERSTFLEDEWKKDSDVSTGYDTEGHGDEFRLIPSSHLCDEFAYAGGGLLSSVRELANYLIANMQGGNFRGKRITDSSVLQRMHQVHVYYDVRNQTGLGQFGKSGYGYGWSVSEDFFGYALVNHGGSTAVSSAYLGFVPQLKTGIAALANTGDMPIHPMIALLAMVAGKDPQVDIPYYPRKRHVDRLTGDYETYKGIHKMSVVNRGGLLHVVSKFLGSEASYPLIAENGSTNSLEFYVVTDLGTKRYVNFVVHGNGEVEFFAERCRFHKVQ
ncbi:hypothetical protein AMJ40_07350 [candidate division TA06 bacterium DG_26]|uniref:Beta-lactamase-related domain-containing protein n=1 Tax=candidate division TA06 bacterium DG_26 TaxID=1703771 RepID=A0A0S7WEC4_UNCT6|nr:MAG: hypothetical protein AMJ40_07350 [candidate division TA06 bacterium DG_26]